MDSLAYDATEARARDRLAKRLRPTPRKLSS